MTVPSQPYPMPAAPPPSASSSGPATPGPVAWLVPLAALLAVIGAFTPWFDPSGTKDGATVLTAASPLYSWKDGRVGLFAPILLVITAVLVILQLRGRRVARFERGSSHPVVAAGRFAIVIGVVTLVLALIAWFMVTSQFTIPADAGGSWSGAGRLGIDMTRGPQIGYWLTVAAGGVAVVGGVLMIVTRSTAQTSPVQPQQWAAPTAAPAPWNAAPAQWNATPAPSQAGWDGPAPTAPRPQWTTPTEARPGTPPVTPPVPPTTPPPSQWGQQPPA